ncbi:MAG TPA: nucleotidyl transferase AbiEii/AbiGii toxin family protein [Solirubrobacterales bacterium]|nr:nucleotidyl transferase AbiEii/AbiGii toxin family protein [Solirubrobacterales bacterium]
MARLRDGKDFQGAIEQAAGILGLRPQYLEKDYWVTEAIRALHSEFAGHFVFKGGTSLSKGYGLIERFSEDVDILILGDAGDSAKSREKKLADISARVAGKLGLELKEKREPGRGRGANRADLLLYTPRTTTTIQTGLGEDGVLLETGFAGGMEPSEMVWIEPMICKPLKIDPAEFEDTMAFQVRALEPVRTLMEKVCGMHHLATRMLEDPELDDARCGRHYWDIDRLLDDPSVRKRLEDRDAFEQLLEDVERISKAHFGGCTPRPAGGFTAGPAFDPPVEIRRTLSAHYDAAAELLPIAGKAQWPDFGNILKRIGNFSELL